MHESVMEWVDHMVEQYGLRYAERVLDVGSLDVNGSTRSLFAGGEYVGIDMRDGPGVDMVCAAADFARWQVWDVVVCTEMLEHDPTPWRTFQMFADVLKPGGYLLITARGVERENAEGCGRPHAFGMHGAPSDYWRYTFATLPMLCEHFGLTVLDAQADPQAPGWFCAARKP